MRGRRLSGPGLVAAVSAAALCSAAIVSACGGTVTVELETIATGGASSSTVSGNGTAGVPAGQRLAASRNTTCGIRDDGTVMCWDVNTSAYWTFTLQYQQLSGSCALRSDGTDECWLMDARPPAGPFIQVADIEVHACGLQPDGTVVCWGAEDETVAPPEGTFVFVAASLRNFCGIRTDGSV